MCTGSLIHNYIYGRSLSGDPLSIIISLSVCDKGLCKCESTHFTSKSRMDGLSVCPDLIQVLPGQVFTILSVYGVEKKVGVITLLPTPLTN